MATPGLAAAGGNGGLILARRPNLRLAMVVAFYVTQGVPSALFYLVIPTWLAVNGYSTADIAAVVAAAGTPATVKFIGGIFVDRFPYLPMGKRKPWILAGQALICTTLLTGALTVGSEPSIGLLAALGFFALAGLNLQDVSIDALIIDLFDERERSRASGFTYGAASLGSAAMIFVGGRLVEAYGLSFVFAILAILPVLVFLSLLPVREREGERLVPWGPGTAHPHNLATKAGSWRAMLGESLRVILSPLALLVIALCAARYVSAGVAGTLFPVMATQGAGWELTRFTDLQTFSGLAGGLAGIAFSGLVMARIGPRAANLVLLPVTALVFGAMALVPGLRADDAALTVFFYSYDVLLICLIVSMFPICMRLCSPAAAATQYALFMAAFNLGRPVGATLAGTFGLEGVETVFLIIAGLAVASIPFFVFVRFPDNQAQEPPDPVPVAA